MADLLCRIMSESYWGYVWPIFDSRATRADKYFSLESMKWFCGAMSGQFFDYNFNKLSWVNV